MMLKSLRYLIILVCLLTISASSSLAQQAPSTQKELVVGDTIPDFSLNNFYGDTPFSYSKDIKGKKSMIILFYSLNKNVASNKILEEIYKINETYKDDKIYYMGIVIDTSSEIKINDVPIMRAKAGKLYPPTKELKVMNNSYDLDGDISSKFNLKNYPVIYVVDKEGKIIFTNKGYKKDFGIKFSNFFKELFK